MKTKQTLLKSVSRNYLNSEAHCNREEYLRDFYFRRNYLNSEAHCNTQCTGWLSKEEVSRNYLNSEAHCNSTPKSPFISRGLFTLFGKPPHFFTLFLFF